MLLYRISKSKYASDLSGEGARRAGGRWNWKGTSVVYTADSTALATLETLVHAPLNLAPKNRAISTIDLPDELPVTVINLALRVGSPAFCRRRKSGWGVSPFEDK